MASGQCPYFYYLNTKGIHMIAVTKWFAGFIIGLLMDVVGALIMVPLALMIGGVNNRLPNWANWFDNDRDPFGDTARRPAIDAAAGLKKGWLRYVWLALRNPANNFGYKVVGFKHVGGVDYESYGIPTTSDQSTGGWKAVIARYQGRVVAFELYVVLPYSTPWGMRCVRVRLGWKLWYETAHGPVLGYVTQLVGVVNPVMSFTGTVK